MGNLLGSPVTTKDTHVGTTRDDNPDPKTSPDGGGMPFGVSSMQGWRVHMEDAHIAQPFLYAERRAGGDGGDGDKDMAVEATLSGEEGEAMTAEVSPPTNDKKNAKYVRIPLPNHSLFAVFDGHGGSFAAEYASRNLLRVLCRSSTFVEYAEKWNGREEHLAKLKGGKGGEEKGEEGAPEDKKQRSEGSDDFEFARATYDHSLMTLLERSLRDAFLDLDAEILREVQGDGVEDANAPYGDEENATPPPKERAGEGDKDADGDEAMDGAGDGSPNAPPPRPAPSDDEDAGTTAVCVLLTPRWIVCANAGDSRAVYARSGHRAVPLSYDHKPDDEDEERRVREAGGYVAGGRVEGDLAVSRGLGDFRFKEPGTVLGGSALERAGRPTPRQLTASNSGGDGGEGKEDAPPQRPSEQKVSPLPDIIVQNRDPGEDEFVVIACDGIWDVQTNQECVRMVADAFDEGEPDPGLVCEEILDLCLMKGSKDNMTAAVIKFPKQAVGGGGGVLARRKRREAAAGGNAGDGSDDGGPQGRAYSPYVTPAQREEGKGDDGDDSDDDQWDSGN